jgi:deoxyribonuclease-4
VTDTIRPIVSHASYLINIAGPPGVRASGGTLRGRLPPSNVRRKSIRALTDEIRLADLLGADYVVLHPGNHLGAGDEAGLRRAVEALDEALDASAGSGVKVLVETTAGQGTGLGWRLEDLAFILAHAAHGRRLGVCADTCHMFAAGYDLRSQRAYRATIRRIDRTVGLERLAVWHLNDCLGEVGCRVDRHTHIGRGRIGREAFRRLVADRRFADCPMIIETPKADDDGREMDPVNLRLLRRLARR